MVWRKFKHRFLNEFNIDIKEGVGLSLAKPINWKKIRKEWDNITRIMLSLGLPTVQQSTLVEKLCSFKQNNSTMLALAEYNRVFHNAWVMSSFKTYCIETGKRSQIKHLRSISPASWEHILLNGFYDLAENDERWDVDTEIKSLNLAA